MLLLGILEGPTEAKTMQAAIQIIVDDLRAWDEAQTVRDYTGGVEGGEEFQCRVRVLNHVGDLPGQAKTFNSKGPGGAKGCGFCDNDGEWDASLNRAVYGPEPGRPRQVRREMSKRRKVRRHACIPLADECRTL
jgi:hypothetical protein